MTDTVQPAPVVDVPETKPRKRAVAADKHSFYAKLIKAQGEMPAALKNRVNPFAKAKYADLQAVLEAIKPTLVKNGLGFNQMTKTHIENGNLFADIETIVFDESNELSSGVLSIPVGSGNQAQAIGSAISYGRRYQALAFFGISSDDDDGVTAGNHPATVCNAQLADDATAAAKQGADAYRAFFQRLAPGDRTQLLSSGIHAQLKSQLGVA